MLRRTFAIARAWSYGTSPDASSRRDARLDLLRGFCVVVMVADHIGGKDSWLYVVTGGNRFFTSAAEGFVLISGVVMGSVYCAVIQREGMTAMLQKVMRRAGFLYLMTVALTLGFALVSYELNTAWSQTITPARPLEFVLSVITLHRSYPLTDVLMLFTLLIFVAPPMLYLLGTGRTRHVAAGALALWLLWQISPQEVAFPWDVVDGGFPFAAWQLPFALGVVVGYHRKRVALVLTPARRLVTVLVGGATAMLLIVGFQFGLAANEQPSALAWLLSSDLVFGKNDIRPGRLVALLGVAIAAYATITVGWSPIKRALGWLLLPLGERALGAYGLHLFVVAFSASWIGDLLRFGTDNTALQFASIAIIWALLPALPWLERIEHLASIAAPLNHPLARRLGLLPPAADPT